MVILVSCHNGTPIEKPKNDTSTFRPKNIQVIGINNLVSSNLYEIHCKMCHGNIGKGDGIKARLDSTICPYDLTKENKPDKDLYYVIQEGKNKMPGQQELKDEDVKLLVFFIKDLKNIDSSQYEIDTVNLVEMKKFKSSSLYGLHCKMCHGNYGTGDGVKARFGDDICPYDLTKENKTDKEVYYVILNGVH